LNQNGFPAASFTPEYLALASGTTNGIAPPPFFGNVTVWNPLIFHLTLSPTCTVTVFSEKPSTSPLAFPPNTPLTGFSGPATTVFAAACAEAAGTSAATAHAASASLHLLRMHLPFVEVAKGAQVTWHPRTV
jgi:hypothetical protein